MARNASRRPLSGLRVLDLSRYLPGPFVSAVLADLGATVTKIEDAETGDLLRVMPPALKDGSDSALHAWLNRGKKSLSLNLKTNEGRTVVRDLARRSDVLIESFRPGVMRRMGLDAPRLRKIAPRLLYVSLSGCGAAGPRAGRALHDINAAGLAGLLSPDAVAPAGLAVDTSLALLALVAILAKLPNAGRRTDRGGAIDLSLLDGALTLMSLPLARALNAREADQGELTGGFACYRAYECADGLRLAVGALEPHFYESVCEAVGLSAHARHQWKRSKQPDIIADFERAFRSRSRAEWLSILEPKDACVTPVHSVAEAMQEGQALARHSFAPHRARLGTFKAPAFAPSLTGRSARPRAPRQGQHSREILLGLGYSKARIADLRASGVIR